MENFIYSINVTMPIFLVMVIGYILKQIGMLNDNFVTVANKFNFKVTLPFMLFKDIAGVDIKAVFDIKYVLFCAIVSTICFWVVWGTAKLLVRDKTIRGAFVQSSFRGSAAVMGLAFIQNIYGNCGPAPLMIIGSVPLYNIMAVVVLSFLKPGQNGMDKALLKKTLIGIITNPIIIGIAAGLLWSALKLPMPVILHKAVSSIGGVATPMGLMAMGATFDIKKAFGKIKPTVIAAFIKLVGFVAVFMPFAVVIGFRREKLIAILVMLGSATTVSSYVMAKNMGHEGVVSSSVVMLTTMCSAFTLTGWLFIMKCFGLV